MATDPWAVVSTTPAPPPVAPKQPKTPAHDPWAVVDTKPTDTPAPPKPKETPKPIHEGSWWDKAKEGFKAVLPEHPMQEAKEALSHPLDFLLGGGPGGMAMPQVPEAQEEVQKAAKEAAEKGDPSGRMAVELQEFALKPRVNISGTKTFQGVFDPKSKNWFSRGTTGAVKAIENQTSLENLYTLSTVYAAPEAIAAGTGLGFQAQLAESGVQGVQQASKKDKDDEGAQAEAWGNLFGNAAVIVGMHYGHAGAEAFRDRDNTKILNDAAQDVYKQKFSGLTDAQKADVLYQSLENSDPRFKKRVDQEVARLNAKRGVSKMRAAVTDAASKGVEVIKPTSEEVQQQRVQAAKNLVRQMLVAKARREAFQKQAQAREIQARRVEASRIAQEAQTREAARAQGEVDRAAAAKQSDEEKRGFSVEESRTAENRPTAVKTTERESGQRYEPEPAEPAIPVTERRAAAGVELEPRPEVLAAESKVNELAEGRMGQSFASLPVSRQRVAARWMERFQPEAWAAFQGTPAHQVFQDHVEMAGMADAALHHYITRNGTGESEPLSPGADIHAGTARLILDRTNITESLQADKETHRDLNEHAEQSMGKSFDSLSPEDRVPALAEYLRDKPDKLKAFLTPDLAERMRSGQHIDLANMEAELIDRQQIHLLMEHRDQIQRDMEREVATKLVSDQRTARDKELSETMYQALTGNEDSLQRVHAASRDLTREASELGLGAVSNHDDLFRIERNILDTRPDLRTGKMNQFLTHMRQVRAAAEDHILRTIANAAADSFRDNPEEGREKAAKQVVEFIGKANDLQDAADNLRVEGKAREAETAEREARAAKAKADAVQVGAQTAQETAPAPQTVRTPAKVSVGRATRVVTPRNPEGYPAHYAIGELTDLQTSHMPHTFEKRPGYNQKGQPRDYATDKDAQTAAHGRAQNLDTDVLLSNGVTTMEGPAVVDQNMDVISANGRTLSQMMAMKDHPGEWAKYVKRLHEQAAGFNIDPAEVFKYQNPVLVKVLDSSIDKNSPEWALMGIDMNDSPSRGISETDVGVAMANLVSPEYVERLTKIIESLPSESTVHEAMRSRSAEIAQLLTDAGVISPNRLVEYVDKETGDLKEKAKDLFETMLSGFTVTDPAVLGRASASAKDKLTRAGLSFIRMRNAGENWNLASMNTDAVKLLTRAQDASARLSALLGKESGKGTGGDSLVEKYLHPERYFDPSGRSVELSFDGQPLTAPVHAGVEALAMALEESPREYAKAMAKYADRAEGMQQTMWGAENPADAFTNEIASKYGLKVIPEEWGAVVGLSDQVKAEIEESRGPLPVEPAAHAETAVSNVLPDSSSVLEAIPEGPKSVQELRKALEAHPGFTQEQAEAVTQLFEDILPRAIGEDLNGLLGNRRLTIATGGKEGENRGYHQVLEDGKAMVALFDTADVSTFMHEMAHYIRRYLNPGDQAVANGFVEAKPGEEWTTDQEEKFAQAFERYHFDGGIRRGKLEKVFQTIHRAMQSIYNGMTGRKLAKPSPELAKMFDNWYDWSRAERKPITARIDVDQLVENASGKVEIPENAKVIASSGPLRRLAEGHSYVFMDEDAAREFVDGRKKDLTEWQILRTSNREGEPVYVQAVAKKGKKLFQPSLNEMLELAKKAKNLEDQLKRTTDPREQARLRGALNGIEDKMKGATGIVGGPSEPRDASVIQLVNGLSDLPGREPTTPAQAATAHQVFGDPTSIELGGERGVKRAVSDAAAGEGQGKSEGVDGAGGAGDREHAAIAKPKSDPLAKVKAAKLKAPEVARGTPVVDPGRWREHVEALGLPEGTPPPTVRIAPDIRELMIYPGQSEAIEGALSALQQYDATILASSAGTGKTYMLSAIAENLLGTGGDKVGLLVTRSQNLIHEADGFADTARRLGVDVQALPGKMSEMTTGMYAATYSGIRGNRDILSVPWDFVLFDESGEAANWTESDQGKAVVLLGHAAKKVVYSSATTHSTVMELGYMHKLGLWPKGGFFEWAQQFGLREVGPNTYAGGSAAKKLEKLRQQLIERGQWQQLYKDMSGTEAHVALVPQTPEVREGVRNIRAAFEMARNAFIRAGMSKYITPTAGHEAIYLKRFISGARLKNAIELGKKAVAKGWTPVFFTEYRSPAEEGMEFFHNLPGDLGVKINKMLPPLPDVVGEMRKAFGNKVGIFAGEANEQRATELEELHAGQKDALYMTYAAGGVGANAQDKVGERPRLGVFIDMPWGGKMLEQGTNRTWRYGSKSGVVNVFMTSDALPEMKLLATKVLPRMRALKAAVFGEKMESSLSRKLRDAAGIPEELLQYEHGEEVAPQASEFEQDGEGAKYTAIDDYEVPDVKKFQNKPMQYKGQGKKLYQGPADRRQNSALRKRIAEMSPEEMRKALLSSDVVDLPNGRAFDEAERDNPAAAVAMSDADGLKAFNDKFGYEAGNALLQAKAAALKEAGLEAYHEKGDEFLYRGESEDDLKAKLEKARGILRNKTFDVTADGKKMTLKGVDFSYGTGTDLHGAEEGLHEHKDEREQRGERKRGELGGIAEVQRSEHSRAERGVKLYQGPKDEDPFQKAANDAWDELMGRTAKLPAQAERVITANEGAIKAEASFAGRRAMRTGEPAEAAIKRTTRDMENEALIWMDDMKDQGGAAAHFVKSTIWMFGTSGDRAVEKIAANAGFAKEGAELKRRMIDYDIRSGNYRGELGGMIEKIIFDHDLKPRDLETVSKVVEGKATSDDPRINKAVADFRKFTATVRKKLADAGMAVVFYDEKGKRAEYPYSKIEDDPNYWPRIYDWNKKFVIEDGKGGKTITSLGEIMRMPTGSERREALIENFAKQRGISKIKAQLFFDRNARGIRLAGNVERSREFELPLYGRDRKALDRYVNEVAEKLASAEVHGQFREKTDPLIDKLPDDKTRKLVNHIMTADLDPARLHDADRVALRWTNRWLVLSKMSLSALKLPFHLARTALATNTRSVVHAFLKGATSPRELRQNAVDCGAMTNYIKQAWMREYGMRTGGLDQKMLDFNGFTAVLNFSRVISSGAGRLWFEKYAYPALVKDPKNPILRRKLIDLYGFNEGQLDDIAKDGYGPKDVKRMELGAANWTTGSGRPSELPPALRGTTGDPLYDRLTTLLRISQSLHGYMFKTANLVNRTVWQELLKSDFKSPAPYHLIARFSANFGLAGWALHEILKLRHQISGSPEAEMEKRRDEWLAAHPASKEALFTALSDITMGMGIDVLTQFFDELATHDAKDKQKLVQQERTLNAAKDLVVGVFPLDVATAFKAMKDYQATYEDTGKHELTPAERREQILSRLLNAEAPISRYVVKPKKVAPRPFPRRSRHTSSALQ